ncbi:MAG: GNAT family N-acetyltransferase [Candidatus Eremiobacteraeota bacterium]|nr:GNAT family N-acetyltransferase [Candidatus Eremiobacteraeota bacterium]MBV8424540.1 GNAT family N-acetyltransferase [Candidatus Eremiobacteraeota bacterium]MBV8722555.1 GNAT family N-acetyltransferase [Candidatus Eremiobacteraeota bacterium]
MNEGPKICLRLVRPSLEHLRSYADALRRGWSPNNLRPDAAEEQLQQIERDPEAFVANEDDAEGKGPPIRLPDGSFLQRLPTYHRWMWDGEFSGSIKLRWQPGTTALPPLWLGHIGYTTVPWRRGRGYSTEALRQILPVARERGLQYVDLTTDPDNVPSVRVIRNNGGTLIERFRADAGLGSVERVRYRITLT